jgi:hypothetical protein
MINQLFRVAVALKSPFYGLFTDFDRQQVGFDVLHIRIG